uniref:Uncharacterized protein n=1 Tax=Rangifer tarandus platyrhynchus TaxID=3082113 RepID=A0ACB0E8D6_RANTA|nr:unnamed protein product [Rangifer tarandus platyrhynchus]
MTNGDPVKGVYEEAWGSRITAATTQASELLDASQGGARKDKGSSKRAAWASSQPWGVRRLQTHGLLRALCHPHRAQAAESAVSSPPRTDPPPGPRPRCARIEHSSEQARAEHLATLTPGQLLGSQASKKIMTIPGNVEYCMNGRDGCPSRSDWRGLPSYWSE